MNRYKEHLCSHRLKALKNHIDMYAQLLEYDEFTIEDFEGSQQDYLDAIKVLTNNHGIEQVESGPKKKTWQWKPKVKERLINHLEERNTFPCGHRASIWNPHWADEYACKVCEREYSREQLEQYL